MKIKVFIKRLSVKVIKMSEFCFDIPVVLGIQAGRVLRRATSFSVQPYDRVCTLMPFATSSVS